MPRSLYAHTSEAINFEALKGKRVAILGGESRMGRLAFAGTNETVHFTWSLLLLLLLSTLVLLPLLLVAAAAFQEFLDCIAALLACRSNRCSCRGRPQAAPLHSTMHNMR